MSGPRSGSIPQKLSAALRELKPTQIVAPLVRVLGGGSPSRSFHRPSRCTNWHSRSHHRHSRPSTGSGLTELRSGGNPGRTAFRNQEVLA